jgi:succinate dehydrogenase / fumarate reductase cytochrome b subunit
MTINDFTILSNTFADFGFWTLFYIVGVTIVAVHVSHGAWSLFQTLGLNHPKYMPAVERLAVVFSLIIGIGFASIPVFLFLSL